MLKKDYIDTFEDIEKHLFWCTKFGYAIGDLVTAGIDMVANTDLNQNLQKFMKIIN